LSADRKKTDRLILDAARDLYRVQGIDGTSLDQIAKKVGIAKPSIYNHFESKEAIGAALISDFVGDAQSLVNGLKPSSKSEQVLLEFVSLFYRHKSIVFMFDQQAQSMREVKSQLVSELAPVFYKIAGSKTNVNRLENVRVMMLSVIKILATEKLMAWPTHAAPDMSYEDLLEVAQRIVEL